MATLKDLPMSRSYVFREAQVQARLDEPGPG